MLRVDICMNANIEHFSIQVSMATFNLAIFPILYYGVICHVTLLYLHAAKGIVHIRNPQGSHETLPT